MVRHEISTEYTNRFGIKRTDVRIVEAADDEEVRAHARAAIEDVQARPGVRRCTSATSRPI